jgi:CubicO group peptidase (beta-lactamase class C family)
MLDPRRVLDAMVAAIDGERLNARGIHVLIGDEGGEYRWAPDEPTDVYSVSKGVSVVAAGIAVDEGVLTLDTRAADVLPLGEIGTGVEEVTLRHLLTMTSGIDFEWFAGSPVPGGDLARAMLRTPSRGPGRVFQYSDASTYVAMRMLSARVGDVREWLLPRLFEPLGIPNPTWQRCPLGHVLGGSGLELRTSELARIGRLLRDGGRTAGRRLVDAAWVAAMHIDGIETGAPEPWSRYGRGCWSGPGTGWRLDGLDGQYVLVVPSQDAVVTITAQEKERDHRLVDIAAEMIGAA